MSLGLAFPPMGSRIKFKKMGDTMRDIVILGGTRTAIGSFGGSLAGVTPIDLGATVAKAAAISSNITATAKSNSDFPLHANAVNSKLVAAINIPARNIAFKTPDLITKSPPSSVKITVVIHPKVFE